LNVHTKNIPLDAQVDLEEIADKVRFLCYSWRTVLVANMFQKTNLYTGADLQNLCREAAMIGLRQDRQASSVVSLRVIQSECSRILFDTFERYRRKKTLKTHYRLSNLHWPSKSSKHTKHYKMFNYCT
jgi:transitional endoplasmic reticulum ATPase